MSYQMPDEYPERRRKPAAGRRLRPGWSNRMRDMGHVRVAQVEAAVGISERRRMRRSQRNPRKSAAQATPVAIPRGLPLRIYVSTRWFSALIVVMLLALLALFLTRDSFFINVIFVGGTKYLTSGEIFQRSGLAKLHIFWVDAATVEARLEADPAIAEAVVEVGWPPNSIQITITEREPALIWEQSGQRVWVDVQGRVMQLRQDIPGLVRVVVEKPSKTPHLGACPLQGMDEVLGPGSCIDAATVSGALQFKALYPNVTEIVYDPAKGLGFLDGRGWVLWFGDGTDLATKMAINNKIVQTVYTERRRQLIEVNVSDPDRPYYSVAP